MIESAESSWRRWDEEGEAEGLHIGEWCGSGGVDA
jgi:hypothetical protein